MTARKWPNNVGFYRAVALGNGQGLKHQEIADQLGVPRHVVAIASTRGDFRGPWLDAELWLLDLPVGMHRQLVQAGVDTIDKLRAATDDDLLKIRMVGPAFVAEARAALARYQPPDRDLSAEAIITAVLAGPASRPSGDVTGGKVLSVDERRVQLTLSKHPHTYELTLAGSDDEPVITSLLVYSADNTPITAGSLRRINTDRLARAGRYRLQEAEMRHLHEEGVGVGEIAARFDVNEFSVEYGLRRGAR